MLRKVLLIAVVAAMVAFCATGCKKRPEQPQPEEQTEAPVTMTEYGAEAEKEITKKNMAEELDKLEKEIEQEISEEP
jgi:thiamine biosynthesis lipoprotein ApbE